MLTPHQLAMQYPQHAAVILEKPLASNSPAMKVINAHLGRSPASSRSKNGRVSNADATSERVPADGPLRELKRSLHRGPAGPRSNPDAIQSEAAVVATSRTIPDWASAPLPSPPGSRVANVKPRDRSKRGNYRSRRIGPHEGNLESAQSQDLPNSLNATERNLENSPGSQLFQQQRLFVQQQRDHGSSFSQPVSTQPRAQGRSSRSQINRQQHSSIPRHEPHLPALNRLTQTQALARELPFDSQFSQTQPSAVQQRDAHAPAQVQASHHPNYVQGRGPVMEIPLGTHTIGQYANSQACHVKPSLSIVTDVHRTFPSPLTHTRNADEEEALKLVALARDNNINLTELVRLASTSASISQVKTEEELFHENFKGTGISLPQPYVARPPPVSAQIARDVFWNTPAETLPQPLTHEYSQAPVTSPSSVFAPQPNDFTVQESMYEGLSNGRQWIEPADIHGQVPSRHLRKVSGTTEAAVKPTIIHPRSRGLSGDRRLPSSQYSRPVKKYDDNAENISFEVVPGSEAGDGGKDGVFLRHGSHISSKPASPVQVARKQREYV